MSIQVITKLIVGYRFSDLCVIKEGSIDFLTEKIKKEITKKFENGIIEPEEVTPELLALILDLDFVEFSDKNDAIIGKTIETIDVGINDEEVRNYRETKTSESEIKAKVETLDPKIVELLDIKISIISKAKVGEES